MANNNDNTSILIMNNDWNDSKDNNVSNNSSLKRNYFLTIKKADEIQDANKNEIEEFIKKGDILSTYFEKETLRDFFRTIFPVETLQKQGDIEQNKPNAIIMAKSTKLNKDKSDYVMKPYIIFDELDNLEYFENAKTAYLVPTSYIGGRRLNDNACKVHSMTFDIDAVTPKHLMTLLYQIEQNIVPKPTYISNSGHGLHLYYVFKYPIKAYWKNLQELTLFKKALTDVIWTSYTSNDPDTEYQSITQGFSLPGSATKLGKGYNVEVYKVGDVITLHELMAHLRFQAETIEITALEPILQREEKNGLKDYKVFNSEKLKLDFKSKEEKIRRIKTKYDVSHMESFSKLSLLEAKEKYPEWYQKRIVDKNPLGCWKTSDKLYLWWLNKMRTEIKVGKRYHSVAVLAALAYKSGVDFERLKEDAFSMIDHYNKLDNANDKPFTKKDVLAALTMYDIKHAHLSIKLIELKTGVSIKRNKRNGLSRSENLIGARLKQQQYLEKGKNWREFNGRKPKEDLVKSYINENPGKTPTEYARELGVSRPTIYKYIK